MVHLTLFPLLLLLLPKLGLLFCDACLHVTLDPRFCCSLASPASKVPRGAAPCYYILQLRCDQRVCFPLLCGLGGDDYLLYVEEIWW